MTQILVVVRADAAAKANRAAKAATGRALDEATFAVPLRRNGNVVAYWAGWNLSGRGYTLAQIGQRIVEEFPALTLADLAPRDTIAGLDLASTVVAVFDLDVVDPQEFLATYDLQPPTVEGD